MNEEEKNNNKATFGGVSYFANSFYNESNVREYANTFIPCDNSASCPLQYVCMNNPFRKCDNNGVCIVITDTPHCVPVSMYK